MKCQCCARTYERDAPFCGECGMTRVKSAGALAASSVIVVCALTAQIAMMMTWMTWTLPTETLRFSVYGFYEFVKNISGVVGGVSLFARWSWTATVCMTLMQVAVTVSAVCGVMSMGGRRAWVFVVGTAGAVITAVSSLGFLFMVREILDTVKTTAVTQAVSVTPAALVTAIAAMIATGAWLVRRVLCQKDGNTPF